MKYTIKYKNGDREVCRFKYANEYTDEEFEKLPKPKIMNDNYEFVPVKTKEEADCDDFYYPPFNNWYLSDNPAGLIFKTEGYE